MSHARKEERKEKEKRKQHAPRVKTDETENRCNNVIMQGNYCGILGQSDILHLQEKNALIKLLDLLKAIYLMMNIPGPTEGFIKELEKKFRTFCGMTLSNYPLTAGVIGSPQITSPPVSSIFLYSPLPSAAWQAPGLSVS